MKKNKNKKHFFWAFELILQLFKKKIGQAWYMIMLSHGWKGYPTDENIYNFYCCAIIGVIVHGHLMKSIIVQHFINYITSAIPSGIGTLKYTLLIIITQATS